MIAETPLEMIVLATSAITPYGINLITLIKTELTVKRIESKISTKGLTCSGFLTDKNLIAEANNAPMITVETT